ncbi:MAG: YraN family protein [Chloroflexota bacterium]
MTLGRQATGAYGEHLAVDYLRQNNYHIVTTNWRCTTGEIDIVARDGDTLVFVEVRTRRRATVEAAFASITPAKQQKLVQAAYIYLGEHNLDDAMWRIDVIGVALPHGKKPIIKHAEDALDW